jgi:hypothetical protein
VGITNVSYQVAEPTHNKQAFRDSDGKNELVTALGEYMQAYLLDLQANYTIDREFWANLGYYSTGQPELTSMDELFVKRRLNAFPLTLQCSRCL